MNYLNYLNLVNDLYIDLEKLSTILDDMNIKHKYINNTLIFVASDDQIDRIMHLLEEFDDLGTADFFQLFDSLAI